MSKVVGDIAISVGADIGPLSRGMDQASGKVKGFGRDFDGVAGRIDLSAARVGAAVGAMAVTAGVAFAGLIKKTAEYSTELTNLSNLAGVSTTKFQEMAYAAGQYGIGQEKLADILKDVNDKVGDFVSNGAGPLKDFFENIAPKVGVTAEQFAKLSGPDALQLYVSSLEKANVSQSQMTFYMEALASDATALTPLLLNNGEAMDTLAKSANDLGIVLDEKSIAATKRMHEVWNAAMASMQAKFFSFAQTVMIGFDSIFGVTEGAQRNILSDQLNGLIDDRNNLLDQLDATKERDEMSNAFTFSNQPEIERLESVIAATEEEMNVVTDGIHKIEEQLRRREEAENRLNDLISNPSTVAPAESDTGGGGSSSGGSSAPSSDTGGGGSSSGEPNGLSIADRLGLLEQSLMSERELIVAWYEEQQLLLSDALSVEEITHQEHKEKMLRLEEEYQRRMSNVRAAGNKSALGQALSSGSEVLGAMGAFNEDALRLSQAFAAAEAWISTLQGAAKELRNGTFGFASAALVLAKGAAFVAAIKSTSKSNSGSLAAGGGGVAAQPVAEAAPQPLVANVSLSGDIFSADQVEGLFKQLQSGLDRGLTLNLERV